MSRLRSTESCMDTARMRPSFLILPVLVALVVASCGGNGGDTEGSAEVAETTTTAATVTTVAPEPGPQAGATYTGDLDGPADLSGEVTLVISASGEDVTELTVNLDMSNYDCDGSIMSGGLGLGLVGPIAVVGGSFDVDDGSLAWQGSFESAALAEGTVQGRLPVFGGGSCEWGPFTWTAEPKMAG